MLCIIVASLLVSHLYWHGSTPSPWLTVWCARTLLVLSRFMRTLPHVKAKLCGSAAGTQQKHLEKVEDIRPFVVEVDDASKRISEAAWQMRRES